jgi:hypothetical protein
MRLTRIRFRSIGRHGTTAPPLPPATYGPCALCGHDVERGQPATSTAGPETIHLHCPTQ